MNKALGIVSAGVLVGTLTVGPRVVADDDFDFGSFVQQTLNDHSEKLFGVDRPLANSALGPYTAADSTLAIKVARGLKVSLVSSANHALADQIALWPNDRRPTHLFACIEDGT